MTCDEVRERLPDHLLGELDSPGAAEVRAHLRGCAGCRRELAALGEGLVAFAAAAHDREPPVELRGRVLGVLGEEWRERGRARGSRARPALAWAAALLLLAATAGWGVAQTRRADRAAAGAASYARLLEVLGGEEFRVGTLRAAGDRPCEGAVVLYDSHQQRSWGLVLVRAPGLTGTATVTLEGGDGSALELHPIEFEEDGEAATWIVTSGDLAAFERATIRLPDGTVLATAEIAPA